MRYPLGVKLWLAVLLAANMIAPLFFFETLEARVVLAALLASAVLMTILTGLSGFTRLLGLGHVLWIPLIGWLLTRLDAFPPDDAFGIWMRVLIALNTISLIVDAVDVTRYIRGDRRETVEGLPS